jgi:hypothetical protein
MRPTLRSTLPSRRGLLGGGLLGAAAMAVGGPARARPWADPPHHADLLLPEGVRAERVLELFLYGGLGPFESFYVVEENGRPDDPAYPNEQWHLFGAAQAAAWEGCGVGADLLPFATDALGQSVKLGPLVEPLRQRPDLLDRMRILVMRHDLEPHEAAIPYALTGLRLGNARLTSLGASVQRYFQDRDETGRRLPYSYVLYPGTEIPTDNLRASVAVGLHPGSARPLNLRIDDSEALAALMARATVGEARAAIDALHAHYLGQQRARYTTAAGLRLPARGLDEHGIASEAMAEAQALGEVFRSANLKAERLSSCVMEPAASTIGLGIGLATHLLRHPQTPARHVTVFDGGLVTASGGGGYDVHTHHLRDTSRNLLHTLSQLTARINMPGEGDPAKIDLDDTMIVLNTEFGRTPYVQPYSRNGTNHHPYGYVTVLIGGPIRAEQRGVVGAIGPDAWADRCLTPAESRAAVLAAMGIYPFTQESFTIGDLRGLADEGDALAWLNEIVLGVKP